MKKIILIVVSIFVIQLPLFASYEKALQLYQEGKYQESLTQLADILVIENDLKKNTPNYDIRFLAAHNHWKLGNSKSAISHFLRCMDIDKENVDPYIDLALLQIELKRLTDAEQTISKGIKIQKHPMLYYALGQIALKRGTYEKAKEMFEKANSIDPELFFSYNDLGVSLLKLKKYREANTAFSVAYLLNKESVEIINNLALSYEYIGNYKKALSLYNEALLADQNNDVVKSNIQRIEKILEK